jgi:hypothetical protein
MSDDLSMLAAIVRQQDVKGRTFASALASFKTKLQKPTPPRESSLTTLRSVDANVAPKPVRLTLPPPSRMDRRERHMKRSPISRPRVAGMERNSARRSMGVAFWVLGVRGTAKLQRL